MSTDTAADMALPAWAASGEPATLQPTAPLLLGGQGCVWLVTHAAVDLFSVPVLADGRIGARVHLMRLHPGEALFAPAEASGAWRLLAVGEAGARWVAVTLSDALARDPTALQALAQTWMDRLDAPAPQVDAAMPLPQRLDDFHRSLLARIAQQREADEQAAAERAQARGQAQAGVVAAALAGMAGMLSGRRAAAHGASGDPLTDLFAVVLGAMRARPRQPLVPDTSAQALQAPLAERVGRLCRQAGVGQRRVALDGVGWWRQPGVPLLAFRRDTGEPVALLPRRGGYHVVSAAAPKGQPLDAAGAAALAPDAVMLYRSFGPEPVTMWKLLRFGLLGSQPDLLRVALFGALGGLLGLLTPMATRLLTDSVIPSASASQLAQLVLMLVTGALAIATFEFTRAIAMLRVESWLGQVSQAAVIDRLVNLPVPFFRQYAAGDLAQRASGVDSILLVLTGTVQSALLGWLFGLFSLAYLFYIDLRLAALATLLVVVSLVVALALNLLRLRLERRTHQLQGDIASLLLQLLTGIGKLRGSGAEPRAFARWATAFTRQKALDLRIRNLATWLQVWDSGYLVVCSMVVFGLLVFLPLEIGTGGFLAFQNAFGQFMAATLGMTAAVTASLNVVPLYERARPILEAVPETSELKAAPGQLQGRVEISKLRFRYAPDAPWVLDDVSIRIEPGQFVAIVGASGSGKSTLLRLLLGFERPSAGAIFYDGKDLSGLDVTAVRRQFGVVLQNGKLVPGDIRSNIAGSAPVQTDTVWAAVDAAGLRADIEAMPMGLHTVITEGGSTLSGGQRQRLMIARALVRQPRILLFDEATSALDNQTQAVVAASVARLRATRIVIAHRLTTVAGADCIHVMDNGRIVESGTYDALMARGGRFAELARRQIA